MMSCLPCAKMEYAMLLVEGKMCNFAWNIMPYSKCELIEDAMNPNNGLLMCPVCDKLFEKATTYEYYIKRA